MRIDTSGRERAKAKSNEVYLCTPFHEEKGGKISRDSFCTFRVYEARDDADHPDREASIFRLRKWVDPPNVILHLPSFAYD